MSDGILPQTSQSNTSASKRVGLLNPGGKSGWPRKSTEDVMLITSQAADLGALTRPGLPARLHAASWLRADRARAPMITQRRCALTSSPRDLRPPRSPADASGAEPRC